MWISRRIEPHLEKQARVRPVVVLTGARQTGKTSLVRRLFPDHAYVSLDLPSEAEQAVHDPGRFLARYPPPVIVDEVQYAPGLLRHLKRIVDSRRDEGGLFVLTGSQPFQPMAGVTESLAGRAAVFHLEGLSFAEVSAARPDMDVAEVMVRGGYPELYEKPEVEPWSFYQSYTATYLERDVRSLLQVGSLGDFERFLRACSLRTSQLLNRADLARDVGISPSTAGAWLSVLERSGVVALLEPWFSNRTKTLVKTPKLHLCDTGLCAFLMGLTSPDDLLGTSLAGALWESMVYGEIRRLLGSGPPRWQVAFWRDRTKEADFLFHRGGQFQIADAKWAEHPADAGKLRRVRRELAASAPGALVCRSPHRFPLDEGIEAVPLADLPSWLGLEP